MEHIAELIRARKSVRTFDGTPLGYPAKKRAIRDAAMRRAIKADTRAPFASLFF